MNVLAVGAHHDDIELGCGGTVARLASEGNQVFGVVLTNSETHYEQKGIHRTYDQAISEAVKSADVLGLHLESLDYPQSNIGQLEYNRELMRSIEKLIDARNIELVITHWQYDMNTDHDVAAKLSIVAARHVPNILQYRSNWYQPDRSFNGIYYVDISRHIAKKKESLECYSVEIKNRGRNWINSFIDHNRSHGFSIGTDYAEVFEPIRVSMMYQ